MNIICYHIQILYSSKMRKIIAYLEGRLASICQHIFILKINLPISYEILILIRICPVQPSSYHISKCIYHLIQKEVVNQNNRDFSDIDKY
jgi:hypothetical protein